jgi:outer membrane cobalamin receptor
MYRTRTAARIAALAGGSFLSLLGPAMAAQGPANAPAPVTALSQQNIERVVVSGFLERDLPRLISEMGTRVNVVTAVDIQNGGYLDVGQSLQTTVPGLYIAQKNGPFDYVDISLHGGRTEDLLWTVDGVRINNRLYAGTSPIDTLPSTMIERIEVLEGTQALFYGTQAIAGAINIVTKDFSDTADGRVAAGADTNGGRHFDGYFRDTLNGHRFVVYGSSDRSEGFQPYRAQDYQPSQTDRRRAYDVMTLGAKYAYDFNPNLRFSVSEQHTDAKLDYAYPQGTSAAYNRRNEDILSTKLDYTPSERVQFFLKGYYHWWYSYWTQIDNELGTNGNLTGKVKYAANNDFWGFTDYGVNALAKVQPVRGVDTFLGYDYQNYGGNDAVVFIAKQTEHVHAFFGEIATNPDFMRTVRIASGVRYNAASAGRDATVWNLSARWDPMENLFFKGMMGTGFRLPTAEELFANHPLYERGSSDTKPEESTNINASVGGSFFTGILRWEAIGFYRDIKNMIGYVTHDASTGQDVFGNLPGMVKVRGGEAVLGASLGSEVSADFSYTQSTSRDSTNLQIARVPEQLMKLLVDYHPEALPFGIFASLNYVGDIFDTLGGMRSNYGGYAVFDLGGRIFLDMNRKHRINLSLRNVFDQVYTTRLTRGFPDNRAPSYLVGNLGLPRTLYVNYGYSF